MGENPNENPKQRMTRYDVHNMFPDDCGKHAWTWLDYLCARHAVSMGAPVNMAVSTATENTIEYLFNMNKLIDGGFITRDFVLATAAMTAYCAKPPDYVAKYYELREVGEVDESSFYELLHEQLTSEVT